jgi:uncharacterized iron-regulated membrane protein
MTVVSESSTRVPPGTGDREAVRVPSPLAALLLRLHFYAGLLVAPFLVVAALTGLAYTLTPQLDQVLYHDELRADTTTGPVRSLAEQVAAARRAHPAGTLASVVPGADGATTQVTFSVEGLADDRQHTVYVDPRSGAVQGQLTTWFGYTPATAWFDDLHRNLHLGVVGRYYSEVAASWLWVLVVGGLLLWWRRRARSRALRSLVVPDLTARRGVRRTRGWHAATGVWLAVGLLFLSATGLTWSRHAGANFSAALDALRAGRPPLSTALTPNGPATRGGHHDSGGVSTPAVDPAAVDTVLRVAREGGLSGPVQLTPPEDPNSAWTVAQTDRTWPVHKDAVAVDPAAGTVVSRVNYADWPLLAKVSSLGIDTHMAVLFGPVNQILLAALTLGLLCVIVWGYRMWWQRRPTRAGRRALAGSPVTRGTWQRLPAWAITLGVPVLLALGWVIPALGVTLLGFLVVDLLLGALTARRAAAVTPTSPAPGA